MTKTIYNKSQFILITIFSLSLIAISFNVDASQLYRYKDERGNTVLNRTIPPKFVGNGYDILNEQGRLIEKVAPALTTQQIKARNAEIEKQKQKQLARDRQAAIDSELKQLYSHPNDAVRILERRTKDIRVVLQIKKNQINTTEKEIIIQQGKAADRQRNGLATPESLIRKIDSLKKDVVNAKAEIVELNTEFRRTLNEFDIKIKRLEVITQRKASDYPALLESIGLEGKAKPSNETTL